MLLLGGSIELFPPSAKKWLDMGGPTEVSRCAHRLGSLGVGPSTQAMSAKPEPEVAVKLQQDWSPKQIAGWLRDHYPGDPEMRVSHETIYRSLFVQARSAFRKELNRPLAHKMAVSPISPCDRSRSGPWIHC